jgi:arylsulfatase A
MKLRPPVDQTSPNVKPDTLRDGYGFDQYNLWQLNTIGSRYNDPTYERNSQLVKESKGEYGPDVSVKFLREFMRTSHAAGKPFPAYYAMELPHDPWQSTPDSAEAHTGKSAPRYFKDNIEYLDKLVGQLVAQVDDLKLRENTLIVFTSDNGTSKLITSETTSGPVTGSKGTAVDAGTHVPLILSLPSKIQPGTRSQRLTFVTDLFPTFLNVAGVTPPKDLLLDGRALLPGSDRPAEPRETIYMKYDTKGRNTPTAEWARSVRFKLHADGKLFDLSQAPTEQPEAAIPADKASAEAQSARQELQQVLDHYAEQQKERK